DEPPTVYEGDRDYEPVDLNVDPGVPPTIDRSGYERPDLTLDDKNSNGLAQTLPESDSFAMAVNGSGCSLQAVALGAGLADLGWLGLALLGLFPVLRRK
ncbi:MAG: hypothetical protein R3257_05070, partial [bacterium]|nr:hypothetical protein [bacterium]